MFITVTTFNEQRYTLNTDYIIGVSHGASGACTVILSGYTPVLLPPEEVDRFIRILLDGAK